MIRIFKPSTPPDVLQTHGTLAAQAHCDEYDLSPAKYRSGEKRHRFLREVYAADEVKEALLQAQHGKCAFCESMIRHVSYGDIEHYRPKAGYRQRQNEELKCPGYYWLAYDWDNLLFCCQLCNQQFKMNHFPLRDGRKRAHTHRHRIENEEPLLIHPARVDPAMHIEFRKERAVARPGSIEGKATIELLGLNRPALQEARLRQLQTLRSLLTVHEKLREKVAAQADSQLELLLAEVEATLRGRTSEECEYASMSRCLINI